MVYFYITYALTIMCLWKYDARNYMQGDLHEILHKDQVEFPLEALGTHGVESWCLLLALCFWSFVVFLLLICRFLYVLCMGIPLHVWCCIVIGFHFSSSCMFVFLVCYVFQCIRNWLGKEEVNGAQES